MNPLDLAATVFACAVLAYAVWAARDGWVRRIDVQKRDTAAYDALRAEFETNTAAVKQLAKDFSEALAVERKRIETLEGERSVAGMTSGVRRTAGWQR